MAEIAAEVAPETTPATAEPASAAVATTTAPSWATEKPRLPIYDKTIIGDAIPFCLNSRKVLLSMMEHTGVKFESGIDKVLLEHATTLRAKTKIGDIHDTYKQDLAGIIARLKSNQQKPCFQKMQAAVVAEIRDDLLIAHPEDTQKLLPAAAAAKEPTATETLTIRQQMMLRHHHLKQLAMLLPPAQQSISTAQMFQRQLQNHLLLREHP